MTEEEKFDELLNSKLSERDFPFNELNWDEAERLIIQQERRRKIIRFALIFSAGLLAGIAIMFPLIHTTHNDAPATTGNKLITTHQKTAVQNIVPVPANQSQVTTTTKDEKSALPKQSGFVNKNTHAESAITSPANAPATFKADKDHDISLTPGLPKPHSKLPVQSHVSVSAEKANKKIASKGTINKKELNSAGDVTNTPSSESANSTTVKNETSSHNAADKMEKSTSQSTIVADNNNSKNSGISPTTPLTKSIAADKTSAADSVAIKTKQDSSNANANSPPAQISTPYVNPNGDYPTNILSAYAGGNYCFGWNDNGDKEGNGISPWAGFNFTHYFGGNISASLGIGYSEISNLNKTYTSSIIEYDFGQNASITTVTPQKVYYLVFPLKIQYNFNKKDALSIGLDYLLLLTTSSTLTTYQQTSFAKSPGSSQMQNGYTQGFSNSNMQITLSYIRMITERLGISAEFYHDLGYIENNSITGINQNTKNNGVRLMLSYELMK